MGVVFGRISEETPKYDVVAEDIGEGVMVRRYAPVYVAKCVSTDFSNIKNRNDFNSAAFRVLAKYIGVFTKPRNTVASEQTESGEKIAMTAPVKLEKIPMTAPVVLTNDSERINMTAPVVLDNPSGTVLTMSFILPSKYIENDKQPPVPTDSRVKIERVPGKLMAVKTFSGFLMSSRAEKMKQVVLKQIENSKYEAIHSAEEKPIFEEYGYNAPFTIPMFRTNEVALQLKDNA